MDEGNENPESNQDGDGEGRFESVKRFKSSDLAVEQSEESLTFSMPAEADGGNASGSPPGGSTKTSVQSSQSSIRFHLSPNLRTRNYRNSRAEDNDSDGEDAPMVDEEIANVLPQADNEQQLMDADDEGWEDFNDNSDNDDGGEDEFPGFDSDSVSSDASSVSLDSSDPEFDIKEHPLFKKEKPKHTWFAVNEINKRQLGCSGKVQSRELFQRRCYGSLNSVKRLELMYKLEEHQGCVNSLNFHPNGTLLASGSDDLKVVVWDWKIGKMLTKFKTRHRGNVFQSKFLHLTGDLHIATCSRDGQVRLSQLNSYDGVRNSRMLGTHKGPCHKLIVLPDQPHIILSAGEDGVVLRHDVRVSKPSKIVHVKDEGKTIALYSIHGHPLKTNEFCVSGRDSTIRIYDQRKSNTLLSSFTAFKKVKHKRNHHVTCAMYNHNGSEILASYSDNDIYLFDANKPESEKFIHQYQGHRNGATIKGVNFFGPKSEFIVSGSDCGHIYFWEKNTEALVQWLLADDNGVVNCLEPHPQLPFICTSGLDWDVKVWVPSCEHDPTMEGLDDTLKDNLKKKVLFSDPSEINETQMLLMLWRHLRNSSRLMAANGEAPIHSPNLEANSSGSDGSASASSSDGSDDDNRVGRVPNCNTH